jgi:hypothetical protein
MIFTNDQKENQLNIQARIKLYLSHLSHICLNTILINQFQVYFLLVWYYIKIPQVLFVINSNGGLQWFYNETLKTIQSIFLCSCLELSHFLIGFWYATYFVTICLLVYGADLSFFLHSCGVCMSMIWYWKYFIQLKCIKKK